MKLTPREQSIVDAVVALVVIGSTGLLACLGAAAALTVWIDWPVWVPPVLGGVVWFAGILGLRAWFLRGIR